MNTEPIDRMLAQQDRDAIVDERRPGAIVVSYDETEKIAKAMVASGFFKDVTQTSQAIVKILAGRELGFGPFASLSGVNVIQNKPVIGANLLASAIKATHKYNYRILEMTDKACEIEFFEQGKTVGKSRFTWDDAEKAGLTAKDNWRKYPRNMLFARAISNGQKWFCPDACNGVTVYTPDEMGATVDEDDHIIAAPFYDLPDQDAPILAKTTTPLSAGKPTNGHTETVHPTFQRMIDEKLVENTFEAAKVATLLKVSPDQPDEIVRLARIYRGWRDIGSEPKQAAERTLAGKIPE